MVARRRAGVGAHAEALVADVTLRVGADDVHQEQILPPLLVVDVAELAPQVEAVQVPDAGHVAGADAEDGALGLPVGRLDLDSRRLPPHLHEPLDMRKDKALGRIIRVRKVNLNPVAVLVGDQVEAGVAPAPGEWGDDLVTLRAKQVHQLEHRLAVQGCGLSCGLLFHAHRDELHAVLCRAANLLLHLAHKVRHKDRPAAHLGGHPSSGDRRAASRARGASSGRRECPVLWRHPGSSRQSPPDSRAAGCGTRVSGSRCAGSSTFWFQ